MKSQKATDFADNISDAQYEQLRKQLMEKSSHKIYATWTNLKKNKECKQIGAGTKCFCDHPYKSHDYLNPQDKNKLHCKIKNCPCTNFSYVPSQGNMDFKCNCKHSHKLHDPISKRCTFLNCGACNRGFQTNYICPLCNSPFAEHTLVLETRRQRQEQGKAVNDPAENFNYDQYKLMGSNLKLASAHSGNADKSDQDSFIKIEENIKFEQNSSYLSQDQPITDAEIMRRKAIPLQVHMYNDEGRYEKSGVKKEIIRNEEDSIKSDQIRINKDWNLKTIILEEKGQHIDARKQLEKQQLNENFKNTKYKQMEDYEQHLKAEGRKRKLQSLNQQLQEDRQTLLKKYGHKAVDDQNEIKQLLEENEIQEDEEIVGGVSAYYLYHLPNKFGLAIKQKILQQDILDRLVEDY